jgi:hypothetical protein
MELTEYHYVYYSYEEYNRGYIGSRTCKCLPEEDIRYFGSFTDKTFKPTQKIILKSDYATREEAYADEIILQEYYKVVENLHFANKAYQTSTGFSRKGTVPWNKDKKGIFSNDTLEKMKKSSIGKKHNQETKKKISKSFKGKKLTEEHKRRISEANTGTPKTMTEKRKQSDIEKGLRARGKTKPKHSEETKRKISEVAQGRVPWNKGIVDVNISGGKNPRAKRIKYNNIVYDCIKNAVVETKKSRYHIQKYGILLANS